MNTLQMELVRIVKAYPLGAQVYVTTTLHAGRVMGYRFDIGTEVLVQYTDGVEATTWVEERFVASTSPTTSEKR